MNLADSASQAAEAEVMAESVRSQEDTEACQRELPVEVSEDAGILDDSNEKAFNHPAPLPEYLEGADLNVVDAEASLRQQHEVPANDSEASENSEGHINMNEAATANEGANCQHTVQADGMQVRVEMEDGNGDMSEYEASMQSESESSDESASDSDDSDDDAIDLNDFGKLLKVVQDEMDEAESTAIPKTQNELLPEELPPEEPIEVSLPAHAELALVGNVTAIVDGLHVVEARAHSMALDLETILFLDKDTPFGRVFDVFGPVEKPFYAVRLDPRHAETANDIIEKGVYYVSNIPDLTNYVMTAQLKAQKGSDASWKFDEEPPAEEVEYSDDEEEREAKAKRKNKGKGARSRHGADADMAIPPTADRQHGNRGGRGGRGRGGGGYYGNPHPHQQHYGMHTDMYGNQIMAAPMSDGYTPLQRPAYMNQGPMQQLPSQYGYPMGQQYPPHMMQQQYDQTTQQQYDQATNIPITFSGQGQQNPYSNNYQQYPPQYQ